MTIDQTDRAKVLIEALPYIQRFNNAIIVVKYGGHAMVDETLKKNFALDIIVLVSTIAVLFSIYFSNDCS